jgi:hypothetical protein
MCTKQSITLNGLFVPNLGKNVDIKLGANGAQLSIVLACDESFRSSIYPTFKSGKKYYAKNIVVIPYGTSFQEAIINSYYRAKHNLMLSLLLHKKHQMAMKEEMLRSML